MANALIIFRAIEARGTKVSPCENCPSCCAGFWGVPTLFIATW
jgi:hypothetical protein